MDYIVHRRFKGNAICGEVNFPALTEVELKGNMLCLGEKPLCVITSENAHQFFARNDDGRGMERGYLTQSIIRTLANNDEKHQERWDKVWNDPLCRKYKRAEHQDRWLWNTAFFNADIPDLEHIQKLIGG